MSQEIKMGLYDMNKQMMNQQPLLSPKEVDDMIIDVASWLSFNKENHYFMLLCHERRDYTLFHFLDSSKRCYEGSQELKEVLQNRGDIISIGYDEDEHVYPIWLRIDDESFLYHLFPYDVGVIEV